MTGVAAAKKRREDKRKKLLSSLHGTKERIETENRVKRDGAAFGTIKSLSEALKEFDDSLAANGKPRVNLARKDKTETRPAAGKGRKGLGNKRRKKVALEEVALFRQVLDHPAVKENPCAAIKEHLLNTLGPDMDDL